MRHREHLVLPQSVNQPSDGLMNTNDYDTNSARQGPESPTSSLSQEKTNIAITHIIQDKKYSIFSDKEKWTIVCIASFAGLFRFAAAIDSVGSR